MVWNLIFFPAEGDRKAPFDFIKELPANNKTRIFLVLDEMQKRELVDWNQGWVKKLVGKVFQLRVGDFRLMYCLDEGTIVVLHACRKKGKKAHPKDINTALTNYENYMSSRGK